MRTRRVTWTGLFVLFLLCLFLGGVVALEFRDPARFVVRMQTGAGGTQVEPGNGANGETESGRYRPPGANAFLVVEQRPLFSVARRPPAEDAPAPDSPDTPASLTGLALTGIIGVADNRVAIVEGAARSGEEPILLRIGDKLRGWTVESIEEKRITLINGDQRHVLELVLDQSRRAGKPGAGPTRDRKNPNRLQPRSSQQQPQPKPRAQPPAQQ